VLLPGLGPVHHPVSTRVEDAQRFFDQGLALIYAFNHDEAARAFAKAAELDPKLAMAHWGYALAVGPNYNLTAVDPAANKAALDAVARAAALVEHASPAERAYIAALAKRYSADLKADKQKLLADYSAAMRTVAADHPDDLDAATLFAESAMTLRPWELWTRDGKPQPGTEEILRTLESVLRRNPDHTGANHYYIHAIEASPNPERGLPSADRIGRLAPGAGHLVHMGGHIYMRVGDYAGAARANTQAARVDGHWILTSGATGIYPMMYYSHNIHFLAIAHAMQGRATDAVSAAESLAGHVVPHLKAMPMLEGFVATSDLVRVRFRLWDAILTAEPPPAGFKYLAAIRHFARGCALSSQGKLADARPELAALEALVKEIPPELAASDRNTARAVLAVAVPLLKARIAELEKDRPAARAALHKAIDAEDALLFVEPPDWYIPAREALGGLLLRMGDAAGAERAFREDLVRNPRHGRSLFGLAAALRAQGKADAARFVDAEFKSAWKNADTKLRLEEF